MPHVADRPERVHLLDVVSTAFGFASALGTTAEHIAAGLEQRGIGVRLPAVMRLDGWTTIGEQIRLRSQTEEGQRAIGDAIAYFGTPTTWQAQRRRRVFGFSGVSSDTLHPMLTAATVAADEIWAPSVFAKDVFERAGARRPVLVIEPGIDSAVFTYRRRTRRDALRVLVFATDIDDPRKGADVAIAAFKAAFPNRLDVHLCLRSSHRSSFPPVPLDDGRIVRRGGFLTPEQLAAEYHKFDVLLCTSRFESFGIVPLEAMATGLPVILPRAGALEAFADLGMGVATRRIPAIARNVPGSWFEPSLDDVVEYLQLVDREYETVMDFAATSAQRVAARYTWDNTARAIADLMS